MLEVIAELAPEHRCPPLLAIVTATDDHGVRDAALDGAVEAAQHIDDGAVRRSAALSMIGRLAGRGASAVGATVARQARDTTIRVQGLMISAAAAGADRVELFREAGDLAAADLDESTDGTLLNMIALELQEAGDLAGAGVFVRQILAVDERFDGALRMAVASSREVAGDWFAEAIAWAALEPSAAVRVLRLQAIGDALMGAGRMLEARRLASQFDSVVERDGYLVERSARLRSERQWHDALLFARDIETAELAVGARCAALTGLPPLERSPFVRETLALATTIIELMPRIHALDDIAPLLGAGDIKAAFAFADGIEEAYDHGRAMLTIAEYQQGDVRDEAVARALAGTRHEDGFVRSSVQRLARLMPTGRLWKLVAGIAEETLRLDAFVGLAASGVSREFGARAMLRALALTTQPGSADVGDGLGVALSKHNAPGQAEIRACVLEVLRFDDPLRAIGVVGVLSRSAKVHELSGVFPQAAQAVLRLEPGLRATHAPPLVVPLAATGHVAEAVAMAHCIVNPGERARVLGEACVACIGDPRPLARAALEIVGDDASFAEQLRDDSERARTLARIGAALAGSADARALLLRALSIGAASDALALSTTIRIIGPALRSAGLESTMLELLATTPLVLTERETVLLAASLKRLLPEVAAWADVLDRARDSELALPQRCARVVRRKHRGSGRGRAHS